MNVEELYSEESKRYDTRKVTNRAANARIDPAFFDMLQKEGLTSEYLESFPYPVFKYITQVTLHGVFEPKDIDRIRVGGYQNVIVNQNKSIGIKYSAIDYEKKQRIARYLEPYGYSYFRDSSGDDYSKSFLKKEDVLREYRAIDVSRFLATKYAMYNPFTGRYYLRIAMKAIYEREIWDILTAVTGESRKEIEAKDEIAQEEARKRQAEYDRKAEERRIEQQKDQETLLDTLKREYQPQLADMPIWDGTFKEGLTIVRATGIRYNTRPGFIMNTLHKKGGWFQAVTGEFENLLGRPKEQYIFKSERVSERTEKQLTERLTSRGKIRWRVLTNQISNKPVTETRQQTKLWKQYNYYLSQLSRL